MAVFLADNTDNPKPAKRLSGLLLIGLLGTSVATPISWGVNHSIIWTVVQGALGWIYVIYFAVRDGRIF